MPVIRLLLVTESFHPVYSGAAIRFRRYLPGLRARGVDVRVLTGTPKATKADMSDVPAEWATAPVGGRLPLDEVDGVSVQRIRLPDTDDGARSELLARAALEECRRDPRIQLVQTSADGPGWVGVLKALRRLDIRTVSVRTMTPPRPANPLRRWRLRRRLRSVLRHVDAIVVGSRAMRVALTGAGGPDCIVIPHGVDLSRFHPPGEPAERIRTREAWGVPADAIACIYTGPISPRKGIHRLLEAWSGVRAELPRARLVLVGPRRDASDPSLSWFTRRVEELAQRAGGDESVLFMGLVDDVERHLRAADMFVFPSRREGMPNAFAEALASGLPVVTVPFAGLPAEFGIAGREYVLVTDETRLAPTIVDLALDPQRRRNLGSAAAAWSARELDVERTLDRYVELYTALSSANEGGAW